MAAATAVADPPGPVGTGDPVINLAGGSHVPDHLDGVHRFGHVDGERRDFRDAGGLRRERRLHGRRRDWLISNHELTQPRPGDFPGRRGQARGPGADPGDGGLGRLRIDLADRLGEGRRHRSQTGADHDRTSQQLRRREDAVEHVSRRTRSSRSSTIPTSSRAGWGDRPRHRSRDAPDSHGPLQP